jgi:glycosyltransferase involved in cell wall biosynthesis
MARDELPKIDVILPFHRIDDYLIDSIKSIYAQEDVNINLILVDDRVEATPKFEFTKMAHILIYSGGVGYRKALQLGVEKSESRYLAFQDSDDISLPNRLMLQLQKLQSENLAIVGCKLGKIDEDNLLKIGSPQISGKMINTLYLLLGSQGANSTWLVDNTKIDKKHWLILLTQSPDWEIAFSVLDQYKAFVIDEYLYFYRQHRNQLTRNSDYEMEHFQGIYPFWKHTCESNRLPILSVYEAQIFATGRSRYIRPTLRSLSWGLKLIIIRNISMAQRIQILMLISFRLGRNKLRRISIVNALIAGALFLIVKFWYLSDFSRHPIHYFRILRRKRIV